MPSSGVAFYRERLHEKRDEKTTVDRVCAAGCQQSGVGGCGQQGAGSQDGSEDVARVHFSYLLKSCGIAAGTPRRFTTLEGCPMHSLEEQADDMAGYRGDNGVQDSGGNLA